MEEFFNVLSWVFFFLLLRMINNLFCLWYFRIKFLDDIIKLEIISLGIVLVVC